MKHTFVYKIISYHMCDIICNIFYIFKTYILYYTYIADMYIYHVIYTYYNSSVYELYYLIQNMCLHISK